VYRSATFPTKREAQEWAAAFEAQLRHVAAAGYVPPAQGSTRNDLIDEYCKQHGRKSGRTEAASLAMLKRKLGTVHLAEMSALVRRDFIDDLIAEGAGGVTIAMNRNGKLFVSFAPAVSDKAAKAMRQRMRRWKLHLRNDLGLQEVAQWTRPVLLGLVRYYGRFFPSALHRALRTLNRFLVRWARRKYQRLRGHEMRAWDWLNELRAREPSLSAHWSLASTVGR